MEAEKRVLNAIENIKKNAVSSIKGDLRSLLCEREFRICVQAESVNVETLSGLLRQHLTNLLDEKSVNDLILCKLTRYLEQACNVPVEPANMSLCNVENRFKEFDSILGLLRLGNPSKAPWLHYIGASGSGKTTWSKYMLEQETKYNVFCIPSLANMDSLSRAVKKLSEIKFKDHMPKDLFYSSFAKFCLKEGVKDSNKRQCPIDEHAMEFFSKCKSKYEGREDHFIYDLKQESLEVDKTKDTVFVYDEKSLTFSEQDEFRSRSSSSPPRRTRRTAEVFLFEEGERTNFSGERFPSCTLSGSDSDSESDSADDLQLMSNAFIGVMNNVQAAYGTKNPNNCIAVLCASGQGFFPNWSSDSEGILCDSIEHFSHNVTKKYFYLQSGMECKGRCAKEGNKREISDLAPRFLCCFIYHEVTKALPSCTDHKTLTMLLGFANYLVHFSFLQFNLWLNEARAIVDHYDSSYSEDGSNESKDLFSLLRRHCDGWLDKSPCPSLGSSWYKMYAYLPVNDAQRKQALAKCMLAAVSGVPVDSTRPLVRRLIRTSLFGHCVPTDLTQGEQIESSQLTVTSHLKILRQMQRCCQFPGTLHGEISNSFSAFFELSVGYETSTILNLLTHAFPEAVKFAKNVVENFSAHWCRSPNVMAQTIRQCFSLPGFLDWRPYAMCSTSDKVTCQFCDRNRENSNALRLALCIDGHKLQFFEADPTNGTKKNVESMLTTLVARWKRSSDPSRMDMLYSKGVPNCPGFDSLVAVVTSGNLYLFFCEAKTRLDAGLLTQDIGDKINKCNNLCTELSLEKIGASSLHKWFVLQVFGRPKCCQNNVPPFSLPEGFDCLVRHYLPGSKTYLPLWLHSETISHLPTNCIINKKLKNMETEPEDEPLTKRSKYNTP